MLVADQLGLAGGEHRQHAVGDEVAGARQRRRARRPPMIPFAPRDQIARVGKRRHPAAVLQPRVPADVIDVQMRAQHDVDVFGRDAGFARAVRATAIVRRRNSGRARAPCRCRNRQSTRMVSPFWRMRKLWMVMARSPLCRILEARLQPVAVGIEMRLRAVGKNLERRQQRPFGFDDALQGRGAEGPVVCEATSLNHPQVMLSAA